MTPKLPPGWTDKDWNKAIEQIKAKFPRWKLERRSSEQEAHVKHLVLIWSNPCTDRVHRKLIGYGPTETEAWLRAWATEKQND